MSSSNLFCYTMDKGGTGKSGSEYANVINNLPQTYQNLKINLLHVLFLLAVVCLFSNIYYPTKKQ